jgi:predicted nucleic acid-binding protein
VNYLVDTNVISEIRKGTRCDQHVASWFAEIDDDEIHLSVLVLGEIRGGIEKLRSRDPVQAATIAAWLTRVVDSCAERILPVDRYVAETWGRLVARRPLPVVGGLLAATALVHRMTLVTRNERDVIGLGATILNPFKPRSRG